jgi:hypothetical protein
MTFYSPSDSKFTRHYREETEMVFSGLDCVLNDERAIYCSSELTTGVKLYRVLRDHGLRTAAELRKKLGDEWYRTNIWNMNLKAAAEFARSVRTHFGGERIVITPGPFSAPGWNQLEYLAFWETLLRTRIESVWFNRNWEFSRGCTFEFAVAQSAGLPTLDLKGNTLDLRTGIELLTHAIHKLDADGFDTSKLRENLDRLDARNVPTERKLAETV